MQSPRVSIIVPVYNAEKFLSQCAESLINQTYPNLEILLIDDGSTDTSSLICDHYATADHRVRVIHQKNQGISAAQNTGIAQARGEYITFADNDDILSVTAIEVLAEALNRTNADISKGRWQQFGVSQIDEIINTSQSNVTPGNITTFGHPLDRYENIFPKSLRILGGKTHEAMYVNEANWCKMYRRELWDGIQFPVGKYAQDIAVAAPIYARAKTIADVDAVLYFWLQNTSSVTHSTHSFSYYADNIYAALEAFPVCEKQQITPARSYYYATKAIRHARKAPDFSSDKNRALFNNLLAQFKQHTSALTFAQKIKCRELTTIRDAENIIYDRTILTMK